MIISLSNTKRICEKLFVDNLDEKYLFANVIIDFVYFNDGGEEKIIKNLKCFIDTGANQSILNKKHLEELNVDYEKITNTGQKSGFDGTKSVKLLKNVGIRIEKLLNEGECLLLHEIAVTDLKEFDFAIGTDILKECEFIYNGHSKTFILKLIRLIE